MDEAGMDSEKRTFVVSLEAKTMKKNGKWIALMLAVALCLTMTGCYQAPDDVNNGGEANSGNNLPFLTLAPTATVTVTPDTVVVESPGTNNQNIFPEAATPTPTADAGGNSWNNWGNTENPQGTVPTAIPTGGTIVFDTNTTAPDASSTIQTITGSPTVAVPTTPAPATPTATPLSMRRGFTGEAVRTVQRKLKELGYYTGSIDGDFGEATEKAVKAFQKANGLSPDGKVGEKTLKKLNDKNAKTAKQANATPTPKKTNAPKGTATPKKTNTPKPTATPNLQKEYYLRLGSTGSRVETLQRRLIELGWLAGKVTGDFDEATEAAVRAFQDRTKGIYTDGIAGPETLRALYSSSAARSKTPAARNAAETLEFGSEGAAVTKLQQKLKDLGYLAGAVDGKFGVDTQAAVIAFQKNNNLTADGKAGTATQNKLYSGTANRASGNAVKIRTNNNSGRDTQGIASTGYETLEYGSEGDAVLKLQKRLAALGYTPGYTDGKFGPSTEAAVMAFQANNNLTVDGKAGPATQRVLYGTNPKSYVTYSTLRPGETSDAVKNMQYTLYELGYYDGAIDGIYGQTTTNAVREFQINNKLQPVDGVAGNATLSLMYSSKAIPATGGNTTGETVRPGEKGDKVVQVQDCLMQFGYLDAITAEYDAVTEAAVRAFQAANGLIVDGVCGPETLKVLFGY